MLAARMYGPCDLRLDDIAAPALAEGTVKVKIAWAGICGSDLSIFATNPNPPDAPHPLLDGSGPHVLGHEMSGVVTEVAAEVEGVWVGDRVAVRPNVWDGTCPACLRGEPNLCEQGGFVGIHGGGGGFSEYVVVSADAVHRLPDHLSLETGALVEPLAVGWHAAALSGVGSDDVSVVLGAGPVGLAVVAALRARGVRTVIVSEPGETRRELAHSLGAQVVDPGETEIPAFVRETTGRGADVVFEAAGVGEPTFLGALSALRPGGTVVIVAGYHHPVTVDLNQILFIEAHVTGSYGYTDSEFGEVVEALADGRLKAESLVTKRITLGDLSKGGLEYLLGGGQATEVKVLVQPDVP